MSWNYGTQASQQNEIKKNVHSCLVHKRRDAAGGHVGAAHRLDLLHRLELLVIKDLVEVDDDLVEEPDALHALVHVRAVELGVTAVTACMAAY